MYSTALMQPQRLLQSVQQAGNLHILMLTIINLRFNYYGTEYYYRLL